MDRESFRNIQPTIPTAPGIYRYYDDAGNLLYVGKAKHLRKRVSSYFTGTGHSYKTQELVRRIARIEYTIVASEQDAFFLENSLIKENQPRFNIELKDDKSYPFIVIKNEHFPRVFLTRKLIRDGSEYLGPYTSVARVRELIQFIRRHIPLRTCKLQLSPQQIARNKYKVCLEYHLGNCLGPCAGLQTEQDYAEGLQKMRSMLKGNLSPVLQAYGQDMKKYATAMEFEKAEQVRRKIEHLHKYQSSSAIVNPRLGDIDVFSIATRGEHAYINFLMVRNGTITDTKTIRADSHLEESPAEILSFAATRLRETFKSQADELVVPFNISIPDPARQVVPRAGDRKKLLDLSLVNVNHFMEEEIRRQTLHLTDSLQDQSEILLQLQDDLSLQDLPVHIECFDNSHFQGGQTVSAMVCFRDGLPSKQDYRHYNARNISGIDDFATMKQVVFRRYQRLVDMGSPLPQLVIIDGGKGQLNAALESVEAVGLTGRMTLVGLAKNEEELFFAGDKDSLKLPMDSTSLKLIRRIRDEVHRFGIGFHRKKRSEAVFTNELEQIEGIGTQSAELLLRTFRSVKKIRELSVEDLSPVVGKSRALRIFNHYHQKND